ncbi:MAG: 3'(2'),5'-bisphosphate nucleotidase [Rhodothermales bacterium]
MYTREREIAIAAVREAAILCRAVQAQISKSVLEKKDKSPVTVADFGSQALVCRSIHEAFAGDPIIAEENSAALREEGQKDLLARVVSHVGALRAGVDADTVCQWIDFGGANAYSDRFWTLDPIDGTKGFLRSEQYAIALALIVEGEIVVSALGCPNLPVSADRPDEVGVIFAAVKGEGAVALALDSDAAPVPVQVSTLSDSRQARFCESVESGHSSHDDSANVGQQLGITAEAVRMDSQAKYATVARGDADIYLRLPTRPGYVERIWDHAAGVLVITEAGGKVTDIHGHPLEFTHGAGLEKNKGVIVTNGLLHDAVLDALNAVGVTA